MLTCMFCRKKGEILYRNLIDVFCGVKGKWDIAICRQCGIAWRLSSSDGSQRSNFYNEYYTHRLNTEDWAFKLVSGNTNKNMPLGQRIQLALFFNDVGLSVTHSSVNPAMIRILGKSRIAHEIIRGRTCWLGSGNGKLLDIGCGSGQFLALMRHIGWDVTGLEPDTKACECARNRLGLNVFEGTWDAHTFERNTFDAITGIHVIEHVEKPIDFMKQCVKLLRPGGRIVIVTPNLSGIGHRLFRASFRDIDCPRHLYLFSPSSLKAVVECSGGRILRLFTSARHARWTWVDSTHIHCFGCFPKKVGRMTMLCGMVFQICESYLLSLMPLLGDELIAEITKDD